jgi:O-antigen/teichoic acid export membrane protein
LIVPIAAIIFSGVGGFVIIKLYGEAYRPAVLPFLLLLPGMIGVTIAKVISADLAGRGKPQFAAYSAGITICITIILDLLFIPKFNISGAAIASSIAYTASGALAVFWFSRETGTLPSTLLIARSEDFRYLLHRGVAFAQQAMRNLVNRKGNDL